ncbi:MAG: mechanosensitive ion channel domain-containing protein [Patescibacteria group bacterium]
MLNFLIPIAKAASLTNKGSETAEQSEAAVTEFISFMWNSLDNWVAAIIVVLFSVYFAKMLKKIVVDRVADKMGDEHEEVLILIGRSTYAAVLGVGLTIGLKIGGIDLTVIIAAVGFGIGFALQDIITNFIAGVILLATRQFAIGDFIEVNGTLGKVKEIQARATILKALDGTKIIVPNADLYTNPVTSYTTNPFRRIEVPVGVEYRTDLKKATNVMLSVLHNHPRVVQHPVPAVVLDEFSDSSINFKVRFWVQSKDRWIEIKSEIIQLLKAALDEAGISIPFPIRTLVFDKDNEKVVIPIHDMTEEELRQHKMEQIQAQQDQDGKDSQNPDIQNQYENGDSLQHETQASEQPTVNSQQPETQAPSTQPQVSEPPTVNSLQPETQVPSTQPQVSEQSTVNSQQQESQQVQSTQPQVNTQPDVPGSEFFGTSR